MAQRVAFLAGVSLAFGVVYAILVLTTGDSSRDWLTEAYRDESVISRGADSDASDFGNPKHADRSA